VINDRSDRTSSTANDAITQSLTIKGSTMDDDLESERFEIDASKVDVSNISPKSIRKDNENSKDV
jgi:hypothetical protein